MPEGRLNSLRPLSPLILRIVFDAVVYIRARLAPQLRRDSSGVGTSLAIVPSGVVFPHQSDGKALSPCGRSRLLRGKARRRRKAPNVRQMLLQFVLGTAFH